MTDLIVLARLVAEMRAAQRRCCISLWENQLFAKDLEQRVDAMIEDILSQQPQNGRTKLYSDDFERFWKAYPTGRKRKKADAWKAWKQAIKPGGKVVNIYDIDEIIAAAAEYAKSEIGRSEYVQMPATWLRGRCWEDERSAWDGAGRQPVQTAEQREHERRNSRPAYVGMLARLFEKRPEARGWTAKQIEECFRAAGVWQDGWEGFE